MVRLGNGVASDGRRPSASLSHQVRRVSRRSAVGPAWHRVYRLPVAGRYAFGRPCVIKDADRYRMWYSHRGDSYRMGYAESRDGIVWSREDARCVLDVSPDQGWDAEMVTYPVVADVGGERFMLYNGNGYGRTGIGLARQAV